MNRYITPQKIFKDKKLPIVCDIAIIAVSNLVIYIYFIYYLFIFVYYRDEF